MRRTTIAPLLVSLTAAIALPARSAEAPVFSFYG